MERGRMLWADARAEVLAREEAAVCLATVAAMEERRRLCFELVAIEGLSQEQAARELAQRTQGRIAIGVGTVGREVRAAREEVRRVVRGGGGRRRRKDEG